MLNNLKTNQLNSVFMFDNDELLSGKTIDF